MSEIRDNFIKTLDDSQCGIGMISLLLQRNSGLEAIKQSQTQNKAQSLAACNQSLRLILSLKMNSSFITSRPGLQRRRVQGIFRVDLLK